ncbi:hypothetical protein BC936DRAFT_141135 [Jimgerdemannia flammicorona]|uniref:Fatty acyl-CoA reductase n=1 Tax=Jimgerdemannia flammicorona TaxID=994334 RepID=A0A433DGA4_9FUNG|nr:hypothetical protein BC936DRAFT_141135 [Jimgerdemannia flammicorona]
MSRIAEYYNNNKTIFITGVTGFVGMALVEKLLRRTNLSRIYVLVRNSTDHLEQTWRKHLPGRGDAQVWQGHTFGWRHWSPENGAHSHANRGVMSHNPLGRQHQSQSLDRYHFQRQHPSLSEPCRTCGNVVWQAGAFHLPFDRLRELPPPPFGNPETDLQKALEIGKNLVERLLVSRYPDLQTLSGVRDCDVFPRFRYRVRHLHLEKPSLYLGICQQERAQYHRRDPDRSGRQQHPRTRGLRHPGSRPRVHELLCSDVAPAAPERVLEVMPADRLLEIVYTEDVRHPQLAPGSRLLGPCAYEYFFDDAKTRQLIEMMSEKDKTVNVDVRVIADRWAYIGCLLV